MDGAASGPIVADGAPRRRALVVGLIVGWWFWWWIFRVWSGSSVFRLASCVLLRLLLLRIWSGEGQSERKGKGASSSWFSVALACPDVSSPDWMQEKTSSIHVVMQGASAAPAKSSSNVSLNIGQASPSRLLHPASR
jgi:hypothetical protein